MNENHAEKLAERAILCGVHRDLPDPLEDTTDETIAELRELAATAGAEVAGIMIQNKDHPETAAYFGEGKLEELKAAIADTEANLLIFDDELTGSQIRNIEDITGVRVIDRSTLILDIFASRARSKEGKIQVELAQLRYSLPRLAGLGTQLSRLGGGIGTRGPGETKLESDRRHIHRRIEALENELKEVERHRGLLKSRREKDGVVTAALVGYTNAGKSTLMNRLTGSDIFAADMLFATLDPTVRALELSDGRNAVIVDTVGFIRKLPHHLIRAFRSTLEEAAEADVLLHVIDAADPEMQNHINVADALLEELGCKAGRIIAVFNKCDAAPPLSPRPRGNYTDFVSVSAATGEGLDRLMDVLEDALPGKKREVSLLFPYADSGEAARLHDTEVILSEDYTDAGIKMRILADAAVYAKVKKWEA